MNRLFSVSLLTALSAIFTGCASADDAVDDVGASADDLSANANFGYFVYVRHDMRRCASPMCGGVYVKRVNQATTRCADGSYQSECYVSQLDFAGMDLDDATQGSFNDAFGAKHGVVRAAMGNVMFNGNRIGKLKVKEAWTAAGNATVSSDFYRLADNGRRCVVAPCPTLSAYKLNTREDMTLKSANFGTVGSASERAQARAALATSQGVLAAGSIALTKCVPTATNCGPWFTAEEFYLPVTKAVGPRLCGGLMGAGCNAGEYCNYKPEDICGAADAMGTCTAKPGACTKEFDPACGCDDKTYSNACMAGLAGVSVVRKGACR
jgi:hypothetical protein